MNVKSTSRAPQSRDADIASGAGRDLILADDSKSVVNQLRRNWVTAIVRRTIIFVGVPTALAAIYFELLASDQYDSVAVLMVQQAEPAGVTRSESLLASGSASAGNGRDLLAMREYILSRPMFTTLDKSLGLLKHFKNPTWDFASRLSAHPSQEQAFAYYLKSIQAEYDSSSTTLALHVRAFEPSMAQKMAEAIVSNTESKLDDIADRIHSSVLRNAELQLEQAKDRLIVARRQQAERQATRVASSPSPKGRDLAPVASSVGAADVSTGSMQGALDERSERATLEMTFAEKAYEASISMLAELRARDIRRRPVLITVVKPSLPDHSTQPRRGVSIITVFVFSFLAMGIGTLTVAAVREHVQL